MATNGTAKVVASRTAGYDGDKITLLVELEGLESSEMADSYQWVHNGTDIAGAVDGTYEFTVTGSTDAGNYSVKVKIDDGTGTLTEITSSSQMIVYAKHPVVSVVVNPNPYHEWQGITVKAGTDLEMPTEYAYYRYEWYIDGAHRPAYNSENAPPKDIVIDTPSGNKIYNLKVYYAVEADGPQMNVLSKPVTARFKSIGEIVNKGITASEDSGTVGDSILITAVFDQFPSGISEISRIWQKDGATIPGETGGSYTLKISDSESVGSFKCIAKIGESATDSIEVESPVQDITFVAPSVDDLIAKWTVHPIPWRDTSFTPVGYWVLDEILMQKAMGKNWKTDFASYEYTADVQTLLGALDKYGECLVQDSRNGYIHKMSEI